MHSFPPSCNQCDTDFLKAIKDCSERTLASRRREDNHVRINAGSGAYSAAEKDYLGPASPSAPAPSVKPHTNAYANAPYGPHVPSYPGQQLESAAQASHSAPHGPDVFPPPHARPNFYTSPFQGCEQPGPPPPPLPPQLQPQAEVAYPSIYSPLEGLLPPAPVGALTHKAELEALQADIDLAGATREEKALMARKAHAYALARRIERQQKQNKQNGML